MSKQSHNCDGLRFLIVFKGINTCSDVEIWIWITAEPNWGLIQFSPDFDDIKILKTGPRASSMSVYTRDIKNYSVVDQVQDWISHRSITDDQQSLTHTHIYTHTQ